MCQLPKLLRYFNLSSNASNAELKKAYLQRVKLVHPDLSTVEPAEFRSLQRNFEELAELLQQRESQSSSTNPLPHRSDAYWEAKMAQRKSWEQKKPEGAIPTVGLSAQTAYVSAGVFAAAAAAFWFSQRQQPAPSGSQSSRAPKERSGPTLSPEALAPLEKQYPALTGGPWNVSSARELAANSKTVWAPSKAWEFQDGADSFYGDRVQGHMRANVGQRKAIGRKQGGGVTDQGYEASCEPQMRGDVEMLPAHLAAADGLIWWLENCGATVQCRGTLTSKDSAGDYPLHHSAKNGQTEACHTLLRLGADPAAKNKQDLLPEELAAAGGHSGIAEMLQKACLAEARETANVDAVQQHPDGIGIQREPPAGIVYTGLSSSGCLRRAMNMAAGFAITQPLPVSTGAADRIINVARGSLQSTEFDLEDLLDPGKSLPTSGSGIWESLQCSAFQLCGLLLYEAPGKVTEDSPGHWVAIRRLPGETDIYYRLDPVRGPFQISGSELAELLSRYRAWRVVRKGGEVEAARTAQLNDAHEEAQQVMRKHGRTE